MSQPAQHMGSPEGPSEAVARAVQRIWPGVRWRSEPLDGGMTNRNFKVQLTSGPEAGRAVVIQEQLPETLAGVVGIQRGAQALALREIESLELAPPILGAFGDLGILVAAFVDGRLLSEVSDRSEALVVLGETLGRLHSQTLGTSVRGQISDPFVGTTWLFDQVHRETPELVADFDWAMDLLRRIQDARGAYLPRLLHADLSEGNVVFTAERAVLIDWEYAGAGDRYFDLGDFAEKAKLAVGEEDVLVSEYGEPPDPRVLALVRVYRFVSMLREGLWSLRAGTTGFLDFDHAGYARICLDRISEIAASPSFRTDLELLEREENLS